MADRFDARYNAGVLDEDPPAPARPRGARVMPLDAWALRGTVLTPSRQLDDAYVEVNGDRIARVTATRPSAARIIDTEGIILPGLIDLHGHPEYNVFAAWEPPKRYVNRYAWRRSKQYAAVVKEPWKALTAEPTLLPTLTRFAEARALVGGVTAIQGASAKYPSREEARPERRSPHLRRASGPLDRRPRADRCGRRLAPPRPDRGRRGDRRLRPPRRGRRRDVREGVQRPEDARL